VLVPAAVLLMLSTVMKSVVPLLSAAVAAAVSAASDSDVAEQNSPLPLPQLSDWQAAASAWPLTANQCQVLDRMAALLLASPCSTELLPEAGPQICVLALRASSSVQSPRHCLTAQEEPTAYAG